MSVAGQKDALKKLGGSFDTPTPKPWAQRTLTRRLLAAAGPGASPPVPVACLDRCPVRPREVRSAVELLAQHASLRTAPVVLAAKGTPYACVPDKFWREVQPLLR